jgi:hypothetical protein
VRTVRRNLVDLRYLGRLTSADGDDARRRCDVDEERIARFVIDCPTRSARGASCLCR